MSMVWTSGNGVVLEDLVPASLRQEWVQRGYCPGEDLYTLFVKQVCAHPRRAAVVDPAGAVAYSTVDRWVRGVASALSAAGLGEADIIGIQVPNGRLAVVAELAVAAIGAVALPLPGGEIGGEVAGLLDRCRASAVIVPEGRFPVPGARLPWLRMVFPLIVGEAEPGWRPAEVASEAPARILVSSGSEAEPKMVAYSHNAMAGGRAAYVRALQRGPGPMRNLVLVPLGSSFGSLGTSVTVAALGGTLILAERFEPSTALRMITTHRPTHVFAVPTMLRRMTECFATPNECLESLRAVVASGAASPETTIEACLRRFGCAVINVYGSADGVNCHTARDGVRPGGGAGYPDPRVAEIRIVDPAGAPAAVGERGEVVSLGPMTPLCYVAAPELNARYRLPGGWVRTGDEGRLDADGRLHVTSRLKQIVVRGGYNISLAEVERQLGAHPMVADVACLAVPDADLGERLCACVAQRPGTPALTLREVTRFLTEQRGVERRKLPESLVLLPELPQGATGKVCRRTLSAMVREHRGECHGA